jgi:hypothetical protein
VGPPEQINRPTIDTLRTAYPEQRDADGKVIAPAEVRDPRGKACRRRPGTAAKLQVTGPDERAGNAVRDDRGMLNLIVIIDALLHTKHIPVRGLA